MNVLNVNGVITNDDDADIYRDYIGMTVVSPKDIIDNLPSDGSDVVVDINSFGGEVDPAAQIYTALKDYKGKVTTKISSSAYSAATIIAMAGDTVRISPAAQMMIHNASSSADGDYHDMDKSSGMLEATNRTIAGVYAAKNGRTTDEFLQLMDKESWLTPQDALDLGLVDEIIDYSKEAVFNAVPQIPIKLMNKVKTMYHKQQKKQEDSAKLSLTQQKLEILKEDL